MIKELIDFLDNKKTLLSTLDCLDNTISINPDERLINYESTIQSQLNEIKSIIINDITNKLNDLDDKIFNLIDHTHNTEVGNKFLMDESPTNVLKYDDNSMEFINSIVAKYSRFNYPAAQIKPNYKFIANSLVASEPLYLIDWSSDSLRLSISVFNEHYQRKVLLYTIPKDSNYINLQDCNFPFKTFNLFLLWDVIPYLNHAAVERILGDIYNILLPGGHCILNFMDTKNIKDQDFFTNKIFSFITANKINQTVKNIGYEIDFITKLDNNILLYDIKKPGDLPIFKLQASLGLILPKTT